MNSGNAVIARYGVGYFLQKKRLYRNRYRKISSLQ